MPQKQCKIEDCGTYHHASYLMCAKHWAMVPAGLQAEVWRTYKPGQEGIPGLASDEYFAAAINAVDAVELAILREREQRPELPLWPE